MMLEVRTTLSLDDDLRGIDLYLLALAVAHQGCLATLDARLDADGVRGGAAGLHRIGPQR